MSTINRTKTDPKDTLAGLKNNYDDRDFQKLNGKEMWAKRSEFANVLEENKDAFMGFLALNANSIDSSLLRQVFLQAALEAFAIPILGLRAFAFVASPALEGTDKVEVPYFPLQATASNSFAKATGYATASDWVEQSREISVGGDGNAAISGSNAATGTARDRKYQMVNFTSYDLNRIPALNAAKLASQAANKLGVDTRLRPTIGHPSPVALSSRSATSSALNAGAATLLSESP